MMKKHVGIDISKKFFDLHILEESKDMHFEYTTEQIKQCVKLLLNNNVELIVMEATGGYELELACALQAAGLAIAIVNPRWIRDFAKAAGKMAKTDKLDAAIIALYGATLEPPKKVIIDANACKLKALVARRNQLVTMRSSENNRMEHSRDKEIARSIKTVVKTIEREIEKVEKEIENHIQQRPELKQKAELLKSVPGIGQTTASMLVTELPELGNANKK